MGLSKTLLLVILALVVGIYALYTHHAIASHKTSHYLQWQGEGFLSGHTYFNFPPAPELLALPDPYNPELNAAVRQQGKLQDVSYYNGRYYLYFGPVPVLLVWLPIKLLAGMGVSDAVVVFVLASLGTCCLITLVWRMARQEKASGAAFALVALAVALCTWVPFLLGRPSVYEASLAGGYGFTAAGMLCLWHFLQAPSESTRRYIWAGMASLCFGLAVGCRTTYIFAALLLLVMLGYWLKPAHTYTLGGYRRALMCMAALWGPWALCMAGLAAYNYVRFGSLIENGYHYELGSYNQHGAGFSHFNMQNIAAHAYLYLLNPLVWRESFSYPFIVEPMVYSRIFVPWGKDAVAGSEHVYGLLANSPFAFFFLAFLLDRKTRSRWAADIRLMANMLLLFSGVMFAFLLVFVYSVHRYNVDYTPWVMALAGIYYLSLLRRVSREARLALLLLGILSVSFGIFTGWALSMCNPTGCPLRAG